MALAETRHGLKNFPPVRVDDDNGKLYLLEVLGRDMAAEKMVKLKRRLEDKGIGLPAKEMVFLWQGRVIGDRQTCKALPGFDPTKHAIRLYRPPPPPGPQADPTLPLGVDPNAPAGTSEAASAQGASGDDAAKAGAKAAGEDDGKPKRIPLTIVPLDRPDIEWHVTPRCRSLAELKVGTVAKALSDKIIRPPGTPLVFVYKGKPFGPTCAAFDVNGEEPIYVRAAIEARGVPPYTPEKQYRDVDGISRTDSRYVPAAAPSPGPYRTLSTGSQPGMRQGQSQRSGVSVTPQQSGLAPTSTPAVPALAATPGTRSPPVECVHVEPTVGVRVEDEDERGMVRELVLMAEGKDLTKIPGRLFKKALAKDVALAPEDMGLWYYDPKLKRLAEIDDAVCLAEYELPTRPAMLPPSDAGSPIRAGRAYYTEAGVVYLRKRITHEPGRGTHLVTIVFDDSTDPLQVVLASPDETMSHLRHRVNTLLRLNHRFQLLFGGAVCPPTEDHRRVGASRKVFTLAPLPKLLAREGQAPFGRSLERADPPADKTLRTGRRRCSLPDTSSMKRYRAVEADEPPSDLAGFAFRQGFWESADRATAGRHARGMRALRAGRRLNPVSGRAVAAVRGWSPSPRARSAQAYPAAKIARGMSRHTDGKFDDPQNARVLNRWREGRRDRSTSPFFNRHDTRCPRFEERDTVDSRYRSASCEALPTYFNASQKTKLLGYRVPAVLCLPDHVSKRLRRRLRGVSVHAHPLRPTASCDRGLPRAVSAGPSPAPRPGSHHPRCPRAKDKEKEKEKDASAVSMVHSTVREGTLGLVDTPPTAAAQSAMSPAPSSLHPDRSFHAAAPPPPPEAVDYSTLARSVAAANAASTALRGLPPAGPTSAPPPRMHGSRGALLGTPQAQRAADLHKSLAHASGVPFTQATVLQGGGGKQAGVHPLFEQQAAGLVDRLSLLESVLHAKRQDERAQASPRKASLPASPRRWEGVGAWQRSPPPSRQVEGAPERTAHSHVGMPL